MPPPDDPLVERHLHDAAAAAERFAGRFVNRTATLDAAGIADACQAQERCLEPLHLVMASAELRLATQARDEAAARLLDRCSRAFAEVAGKIAFFEADWAALGEDHCAGLLASPALDGYRAYLRALRAGAAHRLDPGQERVVALLGRTGGQAWEALFDDLVGRMRVELDGAETSLGAALPLLYDPDRARRVAMHRAVSGTLHDGLDLRARVLTTIAEDRAVHDELRGYSHWLQERNLLNQVGDGDVEALVGVVSGRYDLVARWYRAKRGLLGGELFDYDRYAPAGDGQAVVEWADACAVVVGALTDLHPEVGRIARRFLDGGWVDATPRPGKRHGAFARSTVPGHHPYVLVNFTGRLRDVLILAHELGHGVHMHLAGKQSLVNLNAPATLAESGSLLCEALVVERLLGQEPDPGRRLALLARWVEDQFVAVFRHVAMHQFEASVHQAVRGGEAPGAPDICGWWLRSQGELFGGSVTLTGGYGAWWSYLTPFVKEPGGLYAHAFGALAALGLLAALKDRGHSFVPSYLDVLAAGGSAPPAELLGGLGLDASGPALWSGGMAILEDHVRQLEALAARHLDGPASVALATREGGETL